MTESTEGIPRDVLVISVVRFGRSDLEVWQPGTAMQRPLLAGLPGVPRIMGDELHDIEPLEPRRLLAAQLSWAARLGGAGTDGVADVAVDTSGNVLTAGVFEGTADFAATPGAARRTAAGGKDLFVAKHSPAGALLWVRTIGGPGDDDGMTLTVDGSGNVVVAGYFTGTVDFDPGVAVRHLTAAGSRDGFVLKLTAAGNFSWATRVGGAGDAGVTSLAVMPAGDVLAFGMFTGSAIVGANIFSSRGNLDVLVTRLSGFNGAPAWARSIGGTGVEYANGVQYTATGAAGGRVLLAGSFFSAVDFDPGAATTTRTSRGGSDVFLSALDTSGRFLSVQTFGGAGADQAGDLAVGSDGSIHVVGNFTGTADFDPGAGVRTLASAGGTDAFVLRLSPADTLNWARRFGSGAADRATDLVLDHAGNVCVTGHFAGTVDFDPGPLAHALTSAQGGSDAFVLSLSALSGDWRWAGRLGGATNHDVGEGIARAGNHIVTIGRFAGAADFDPGVGSKLLTAPGGKTDGYLVKLTVG